jgi:major membrane immunogen (membrane-anchored lipoprotein)
LVGSLENQLFRNQQFITKRGNLKNTLVEYSRHRRDSKGQAKKKKLTTRSLLSLEGQRAQRIELDRIDRIFLNLD